jgi:tetratricopeptide (TPR) repeat protein
MMMEMLMSGKVREGMLSLKGIMFAQSPILFALLALLGRPALAADPKQIYDESTNALYNLDFSTAQRGYETLTRGYPDNPDYWNGLASATWLKIAFDQQKLSLESFSGRSLGTRDSRDIVNPADEKRLRDAVATAIEKADARLKKNPNDVHALYAKGISNGILASFEATAKRSYVAAQSKAKAAHDLHEEVLKLDPMFDDAQLGVGAYDYVIGVIPGFLRFLLSPFGIRSAGKDMGIQELETAAEKGKLASTDAKMILLVVYNREKRYEQALQLLGELRSRFPRNFLMQLSEASVYGKMHRWEDADRLYRDLLQKVQSKKDGYDRLRQARVLFGIATNEVDAERFEDAIDGFNRVISSGDGTPDEKGRSYLWLGKLYDSKKDRAKALEQYDALLALDCRADLKMEAQRYKRRPYGE